MTPDPEVSARWVITGRVQGVGFRWFVSRRVAGQPIRGWVENLPDGRVEVVAQGPASILEALGTALRGGPRLARVDSVEKSELSPEVKVPNTFEVH